MVNYLELPIGDRSPEVFRTVIEIPKDGTQKFEYDKQLHVFKLDRNLHSPVHYPGDYGFIPSTLSDDGDPLDVLVLVPGRAFPAACRRCGPSACWRCWTRACWTKRCWRWERTIPRYNNVWNYTDIYPHMLKEITHFFSIYKDLEGKRVEIKGWHDAAYARDQVVKSAKQFQDNKQRKAASRPRLASRHEPPNAALARKSPLSVSPRLVGSQTTRPAGAPWPNRAPAPAGPPQAQTARPKCCR
jgi:inorganic pyrophosphatase